MQIPIDESEARLALGVVEHRRQQVLAEINVPYWYWVFLAAGWIGLGALGDFAAGRVMTVATVVFGAAHSSIAPHVISGRNGSPQLSIRGELVSRRLPAIILGFVVMMAIATVGVALALNADGARHPALLSGAIIALLVLAGGPSVVAAGRRRAPARS